MRFPMLIVVVFLSFSLGARAAELEDALQNVAALNQGIKDSQERINDMVDETERENIEYKTLLRRVEGLKVYNAQQRALIRAQGRERAKLSESIDQVTVIERQISPLMQRMIDGLAEFVRLDIPFLIEERRARLEYLRETLARADVSVSEKFGAILNAYQIESEYGRTMEAYSGELPASGEGGVRIVDFLKFGRVTLVYQTTDGEESGYWDTATGRYEVLDDSYNTQIRGGIRMARKQAAVDVVIMPVFSPSQ